MRQARAQRDVTAAGLQPSLDYNAAAQRARSGGGDSTNQYSTGVDASWELDLAGGTRAGVAAADADIAASQASLGDTKVSVAAEVALAYIELRGNQARLALARDNLAAQAETLQLTRWREQAGLATMLDVEQARAATEQTRARLPSLESSIVQAQNSLAVLLAQAPGTLAAELADPVAPLSAIPHPAGTLALSLPADTLRQRPDVRAAERRVAAATARLRQADAARYPSLRIGGSLGLSALTLGALTSGGAVSSSLLASLSLPLFDGGAIDAQIRAQDAALEQNRQSYVAAVLGALRDVENALTALRTSRDNLASLEQAADAAANADEMAGQRYASGLVDFQVVLDTQQTRLSVEDSVASAVAQVAANHVQLYKALGGGWRPEAIEPADEAMAPAPGASPSNEQETNPQ